MSYLILYLLPNQIVYEIQEDDIGVEPTMPATITNEDIEEFFIIKEGSSKDKDILVDIQGFRYTVKRHSGKGRQMK